MGDAKARRGYSYMPNDLSWSIAVREPVISAETDDDKRFAEAFRRRFVYTPKAGHVDEGVERCVIESRSRYMIPVYQRDGDRFVEVDLEGKELAPGTPVTAIVTAYRNKTGMGTMLSAVIVERDDLLLVSYEPSKARA